MTCLDRNSHYANVCIFTIRICNFSNVVALCTDDTDTPVSCGKLLEIFGGMFYPDNRTHYTISQSTV